MRGGSRLVAVAGLVAIGSLLPSANATSGRHCAIQLNPISRHGSVIEARGTVVGCYPTFAQALAAGSDRCRSARGSRRQRHPPPERRRPRRVAGGLPARRLAEPARSAAVIAAFGAASPLRDRQLVLLGDDDLPPVSPTSSVLIGTEYNALGFGGSSNDYFASTACAGTDVWEVNYVGDAWNDLFSSGKGFGGCDHNKKFQDADFGGSVLTCTPNCNDYGLLSNEVSSLRWKP